MKEKELDELINKMIVPPGKKVSLKNYDTTIDKKSISKETARKKLADSTQILAEYQDKLYAQDVYALLVIFQALDAAGKDGTIKHVMSGVNPQGCQVYNFKEPSYEELDHDFLWRCSKALPERGRIGIFNRSYYEEVLVARVHPELLRAQRLPDGGDLEKVFSQRYEDIGNYEKYLVNNGIIVLKFFLHVSKEEQKKRFLERIDKPDKNWKFALSDVKERQYFEKYIDAYEQCFRKTSTKWAPWYVIPADYKPFTRLAVAHVIARKLASLGLAYPQVTADHKAQLQIAKRALETED